MSVDNSVPSDSNSARRLENLERLAEESAKNSLAVELSSESLESAVRKACKHEDREIVLIQASVEEYAKRGQMPPIACAKGCWHCCAQIVGATIPEVLRIAKKIRGTWPADDQRSLLARIVEFEARTQPFLTGKSSVKPRDPCPLLRDGECSVWQERPFICRGVNSTDVSACIRKREDPSDESNVPQVPAQFLAALYSRTGFRRAIKLFRLDSGLYELASSLRLALENERVEQEYLEGQNPFRSMEIPSRSID